MWMGHLKKQIIFIPEIYSLVGLVLANLPMNFLLPISFSWQAFCYDPLKRLQTV